MTRWMLCIPPGRDRCGGIDNELKVWDLRNEAEPVMTLRGHTDTITGLAVSPDGTHVLSNAMDCTLRMWDMRQGRLPLAHYLISTRLNLRCRCEHVIFGFPLKLSRYVYDRRVPVTIQVIP